MADVNTRGGNLVEAVLSGGKSVEPGTAKDDPDKKTVKRAVGEHLRRHNVWTQELEDDIVETVVSQITSQNDSSSDTSNNKSDGELTGG